MRIVSLIDDAEIIKKILKHLSLWDVKHKPPARANGPPPESFIIYDESSSPSNAQFHVKKSMLTIKPASAIRKVIVCVNGCFNMLC